MVTPYQKELCIDFVKELYPKASHTKACKLFKSSRTKKYYQRIMPEKDLIVKNAIQEILGTARLGRKKVIAKVRRKYPELGASKIRRVYQNEGFSLYKRFKRKRFDNPANPIEVPLKANVEWAMDFMSDSLINGKKFRTLNILDQYNRKCLEIGVNYNMPSHYVIEIVQRAIDEHGKPLSIRTDNGPEFTSHLFQEWLEKQDIKWVKIQKGKPQQNAIIERFNKTFRQDILDAYLFKTLCDIEEKASIWKQDYNDERPHEALNDLTPNEYAA